MDFEECKTEGYLEQITPDSEKMQSIRNISRARRRALLDIGREKEKVSIIVEQYYESIKELLIALLLKEG